MSDERGTWTYAGPATLVSAEQRIPVDADLHIEMEREASDSVLALKSWCGTATAPAERQGLFPFGIFQLVLPNEQEGTVYVNATVEDGTLTLDLQGRGVAPWLPTT